MAASLWVAALFAPVEHIELNATRPGVFSYGPLAGWDLALWGWQGPLVLAPGWFANIPFAICLFRMVREETPGRRLASIALAIAATALLPHGYWGQNPIE